MRISAIVAMSKNYVIGKSGRLPWHLPEDLKKVKALTWGHPLIMGRKTFESIGRVLPGRENVIISRQPGYQVPGACVVSSVEAALEYCRGRSDEVFIFGGAEVYRQAFPYVQRVYLTWIDEEVEGDTVFPAELFIPFHETHRESHETPIRHSYVVLDRNLSE